MSDAVTKIAICGSNPVTINEAPFGDPTWSIWACSPDNTPFGNSKNARELPRCDERFELHDPLEDPTRPFPYLQYLTTQTLVWMRDKKAMAAFPGAKLFPEHLKGTSTIQKINVHSPAGVELRITEIPNMDGVFNPYMFTSSIAYMLAKAIVDLEPLKSDGVTPCIGLWGILQATDGEYSYQRPGLQSMIYEAMKRGIKVIANRESCLFDMPQWKW